MGEDGVSYRPPVYVGSATCQICHEEIYASFMETGHPFKLNKVVDGQPPDYPFSNVPDPPEGYSWGRYPVRHRRATVGRLALSIRDGFIITGEDENATTQYNLYNEDLDLGDDWVAYHPGEEKALQLW